MDSHRTERVSSSNHRTHGWVTWLSIVGIVISYSAVLLPGGHGMAFAGIMFVLPQEFTGIWTPLTWGGIAALVCSRFSRSRGVMAIMNAVGTTSLLLAWIELILLTDPRDHALALGTSLPFLFITRFFDLWTARAMGPRNRSDWQFSLIDGALVVFVVSTYALGGSSLFMQ